MLATADGSARTSIVTWVRRYTQCCLCCSPILCFDHERYHRSVLSLGAPFETKLAGPNEPGERLIIIGKVYGSDCRSYLPNTLIEVWQANNAGQYDTDKPGNFTERVDFHLRGMMLTDQQGNYEFETIMPGRYPIPPNVPGLEKFAGVMRPAHIHFRVSELLHVPLTTQLYFKGDPNIAKDPWARSKPSMAIDLKQDGKFLHGNLDFVLDNSQAPPSSN